MRTKNSISLKICGLTDAEQAKTIALLGVDAIGVIGVKKSKRYVAEVQRRKIFSELTNCTPLLNRVLVIANMSKQDISLALKGEGTPSIVQLHGNESQEECLFLRKSYPDIQWWKALQIRSPKDLQDALIYEGKVDALLLDAWSPLELGGTGNKVPLEWLQKNNLKIPWWLAGGINAEYIPQILSQVTPFGIDASSKLEISPGIKDIKAVKSLIKVLK